MEDKLKNILALYVGVDVKNIIKNENSRQQGFRYGENVSKVTMKFDIICKREILGFNKTIVIKSYLINMFENGDLEIKIC